MYLKDLISELQEILEKEGDIRVISGGGHPFSNDVDDLEIVTISEDCDTLCHLVYEEGEKEKALLL